MPTFDSRRLPLPLNTRLSRPLICSTTHRISHHHKHHTWRLLHYLPQLPSVAELEVEGGSGGEEVEGALPEDGTELDPEMYGSNMPVVKVGRRRQSLNPTGVWVHV